MNNIKFKEDVQLISQYICGDRSAGEKVFASAYPALQRFVYNRTKGVVAFSQNDKEDIISEAMVRVVDKLHLYNGTCKFQTFIIGYANIIIKEQVRKKTKEVSKVISIDETVNLDDIYLFGKDPLEVLIEKEKKEAVTQAIHMLSGDHKDILTLRLLNEVPIKYIIQISGKSEDALDSLFRRAIKAFRNNFNKIYNNATDFK